MGLFSGIIRIFGAGQLEPPQAPQRPVVAAVVVAAGSSSRMGTPKQLIPLCGVPVIARTLMALDEAECVDEIVLVARQADMLPFYDLSKRYGIRKLTKILIGGGSRQQSVARGVEAVKPETAYVAIHDGARPLLRPQTADRVIEAAFRTGAAAAGVHVKDTVKLTDENGVVTGTPDRRFLWNVQTPQVFELTRYRRALLAAQAAGREYTDDCQLMEHAGFPVQLIEAEYTNLKITTPEDVAFAEAILRQDEDDG